MRPFLSLIMITKNAANQIESSFKSVKQLANEIIVVDAYSNDGISEICKNYGVKLYFNHQIDASSQRAYGLTKAKGNWILILDHDESLSKKLRLEISKLKKKNFESKFNGYYAPFQSYYLGRKISHGGESYSKLILFNKQAVKIESARTHEKFELIRGKAGYLRNKVNHYSYRSLFQVYKKFTDYAIKVAKDKKTRGEQTSLKKIILYPLHMFWARFVEDKGYQDGFFRVPLDLGFAYMEFLIYFLMLFI